MGLFVQQNDTRSELQQRLASELQEKARKRASGELPDGVEDSQYIKGTKRTTKLMGVWIAIAVLAIAVLIYLIIATAQ